MLNDDKTEFLLVGTRKQLTKVSIDGVRVRDYNTVEPRLSRPRLSRLFDYPDFFLWSQFFHEYQLVVIVKTQSRKSPIILSKDC